MENNCIVKNNAIALIKDIFRGKGFLCVYVYLNFDQRRNKYER